MLITTNNFKNIGTPKALVVSREETVWLFVYLRIAFLYSCYALFWVHTHVVVCFWTSTIFKPFFGLQYISRK